MLKEIDGSVITLVSSGYSNDPVMADHTRFGFSGIVHKPYRIEDIRDVLEQVTASRNGTGNASGKIH